MISGVELRPGDEYYDVTEYVADMSVDDYFAARAMALIYTPGMNATILADQSYEIADAFMKVRSERIEKGNSYEKIFSVS